MRKLITFDNYEIGDIIISLEGSKAKVLEKFTQCFVRSAWDRKDLDIAQEMVSVADAKNRGWRFMQEGKQPMTRKEVEGQFNIKIMD